MREAPFVVERVDEDGLVLLLGRGPWWTRLSGECLEGVVPFLRGRGWVKIGSRYETAGDAGSLDGLLKRCTQRATAAWVAAVLERAGVVEVAREHPAKVRLSPTLDIG